MREIGELRMDNMREGGFGEDVVAEPSGLALGVLVACEGGAGDGFGEREVAFEVGGEFGDAEGT